MSRSLAFFTIPVLRLPHNNRELYLARELAARGWDVRWLLPRSGGPGQVHLQSPELRYPDLNVRGRTALLPVWLAARLRREGVRVLWLSGWSMRALKELAFMVLTLRAAGIRVVYDPIDPHCEFAFAQGALTLEDVARCYRRARRVYQACDLVVAVTPEMRELLIAHGSPADRTIVGRWGTDEDRFDPRSVRCDFKQRIGIPENTFLAGWLGTMEPFKGLEEVVLPVMQTLHDAGQPIHFVLAGRGTLEPTIRAWAVERPDLPLTVLPSIAYDDAPAFTGSLDAYLVPTNPGTEYARSICPVKCFDALAMGTHQVVTRTPATAFLGRYPTVALAGFDRDSFCHHLLRLHRMRGTATTQPVTNDSHQAVAIRLADAIGALAG